MPFIPEWRHLELRAIQSQRKQKIEILIDHPKATRHSRPQSPASPRPPDSVANHAAVAAKSPMPVAVAQHHRFPAARILIIR